MCAEIVPYHIVNKTPQEIKLTANTTKEIAQYIITMCFMGSMVIN